ncbi:hypothetical protein VC83_08206 [Pseudogymnoascus destructans]|uniref:NTF2 domain-containing protein n=2 Tax=Pseudogymnoascus destructans TaxID=655981 RepID=L8FY58_PSED2|nr:uncharacterized protein VC83_08206 [Pseudogymnoascus destructans]ELR05950.1 hypothetical protein GMDG_01912 [Pseudogymnoascus destructans 20631-21]OAF55286.1 hypothetical protein VC83_08206 [Pseudogymnoascus destructans]
MAATSGVSNQQEPYKSATEQYTNTASAAETASGNANGSAELSKDEIGWYFVEQYYTTLSKSPEKLHLFYGKRSQFVSGLEAEVAPVSVGRPAIQERIKSLEFQDCKVRVSNVDSQGSDETIVIQVIGETSNKSAELKKFVQTFVLAQQPTGYFVLNDIFRYINEEAEEEVVEAAVNEEAAAPATEDIADVEMPKAQASVEEPKAEVIADVVDKKLELDAEPAVLKEPQTNGTAPAAAVEAVEETAAAPAAVSPEVAEKELEEEAAKTVEIPKDPLPTPAVTEAAAPKAAPVPAAPAKPMSWANRAAAAAAAARPAMPAVPHPKTASPVPAQQRAPAPAVAPAQAAAPASPTTNKENEGPQSQGWQTAGADTKRQRPQSISAPLEKEGTMGYVRNVTEAVQADALRAALAAHGELVYFDINRQKNCAFVEFASSAGYQAALAANPHHIGGEAILVEHRRPKSSAYGGAAYNTRGGINNRGRGGFERGPGGQRGRGNFGGAARGGAPRGRGQSTPTTA